MKHGEVVTEFERAFADYVGAQYAIAMTNGTVTMEVALRALGVGPGERIATTPLTMAATSIAILNVNAKPVYRDVDPTTWLMNIDKHGINVQVSLPVSLYGLHHSWSGLAGIIDDAAQTLRKHGEADFTSYSFQRSKILNTGEGGMLVTDDAELAAKARSIASLGYDLSPTQSRIDSATIKAADAIRHVRYPAMNARMNDATAAVGLARLAQADELHRIRQRCADLYRQTHAATDQFPATPWITAQHVPEGWAHDYWCYAIACDTPERARELQDRVAANGGERPYAAWRITYREPALSALALCPVAESLQPRILQFQTNDEDAALQNAFALARSIIQMESPTRRRS
jgi:perosamine synthetase